MLIYQSENIGSNYEFRSHCHHNWSVPPHIHEYSEILYTISGCATMYLDGVKRTIPQGHMAFIMPNHIHAYTDETPAYVRCAVFSNDFIPAFFERYQNQVPTEPVIDLTDRAGMIEELAQTATDDIVRLSGLLNLLFAELPRRTELQEHHLRDTSLYMAAINYISTHFLTDFTLRDMARELGYHEKYLSPALHTLTGMNFRTFLASYRIDYAKSLLRSGKSQVNISEIALQCGFPSINTFNRTFKQMTGLTPSEYRQRHKQPFS